MQLAHLEHLLRVLDHCARTAHWVPLEACRSAPEAAATYARLAAEELMVRLHQFRDEVEWLQEQLQQADGEEGQQQGAQQQVLQLALDAAQEEAEQIEAELEAARRALEEADQRSRSTWRPGQRGPRRRAALRTGPPWSSWTGRLGGSLSVRGDEMSKLLAVPSLLPPKLPAGHGGRRMLVARRACLRTTWAQPCGWPASPGTAGS